MDNRRLSYRIDEWICYKQDYGYTDYPTNDLISVDLLDKKLSDFPYIETVFIIPCKESIYVQND